MKRLIIAGATLLLGLEASAEVRTFTNSAGKQIKAELVEIAGEGAVLKMGGKNFTVPISSLSAADQTFIKEWGSKNSGRKEAAQPDVKANWDGPWPKLISGDVDEIEVIKEDKEAGKYVYASDHYEFICDVKLNTSVVKRFSLLFEATNQFCRELPLGMIKPFREERHKILLFEEKATYHKKGGPEGSAGVYISRGGEGDILIPLTSLGVKRVGSSFSVDYKKENSTISHEICHQVTDYEYYAPGSRGWFTEGLAEYISMSGYRSGKFNVNDLSKLKETVCHYGENNTGGKALGEDIKAPDLKAYMTQDYGSFVANSQLNYGLGALVVYYWFHMDGEKDAARIKEFLKGLKAKKSAEEAYEALLDGRSWDELEEDIHRAWRSRGVKINFS